MKVRGICGDRLTCGRSSQQSQEDAQVFSSRNQLFHAHAGNMHLRQRDPRSALPSLVQMTIPPVSAMAKLTPVSPASALTESLPQMITSRLGQIIGIRGPFFCPQVLMKALANFFLADMNRGQHDVAGRFLSKLHNAFAEVRVDDVNSVFFQERIEMTFFGQHRLAFHQPRTLMPLQNAEHDLIVLMSIRGPVNDDAILRGVGFKLFQILGHPRLRVPLDG
jgi:hypothetical protein